MRIRHIVFKENRHKKLAVYQYPKSWNFLNFLTGANSFFLQSQSRPKSSRLSNTDGHDGKVPMNNEYKLYCTW